MQSSSLYSRLNYNVHTNLISFLRKKNFLNKEYAENKLCVPTHFSFEKQNDESLFFFKKLLSSYLCSNNSITLDFTNCQSIDISNVMLLDILLKEIRHIDYKYNLKYYHKANKTIKYIASKHNKVNKCLFAFGLIKDIQGAKDGEGYLLLGLKKGLKKRMSYKENVKGEVIRDIRNFINDSLKASNVELNSKGIHKFDRLLSEILNNAEDHSTLGEWYVNGISYKEIDNGKDPIIEFNLAILNLGFSIAKGYLKLEDKNASIIKEVGKWYETHLLAMTKKGSSQFDRDDLYTLYCLQEGVSRLKYDNESRGNGTMTFIRAFIELGCYGNSDKNYRSHLNIISGNTIINCDNDIKPYTINKVNYLSLNNSNSLDELPDKKYLKHSNEYFPGTFLEAKIYLNKKYFKEILEK